MKRLRIILWKACRQKGMESTSVAGATRGEERGFLQFRSPSPFYEWEVDNEENPQSPSQSSDQGTDSQLESSEGPDIASEMTQMDWAAFFEVICEDSEMLPLVQLGG